MHTCRDLLASIVGNICIAMLSLHRRANSQNRFGSQCQMSKSSPAVIHNFIFVFLTKQSVKLCFAKTTNLTGLYLMDQNGKVKGSQHCVFIKIKFKKRNLESMAYISFQSFFSHFFFLAKYSNTKMVWSLPFHSFSEFMFRVSVCWRVNHSLVLFAVFHSFLSGTAQQI